MAHQMIKTVALLGASGNIGPHILKGLQDAKLKVTVVTRESSNATFSDVTVAKTDYSEASLIKIFKGIDAVVVTIGGAGFDVQTPAINAAVKAGVKRFLPSELGSDTQNALAVERVPIFKHKLEAVALLRAKSEENPDFTWTAPVSGPFFDWGLNTGFLGFDVKDKKALIFDKGDVPTSASTVAFIGRAVASILLHPAETKNKYIYFASFTVTQNQILAALEKATGSKWSIEKTTSAEAAAEGKAGFEKQDFMTGLIKSIQGIMYTSEDTGKDFEKGGPLANHILELPNEDLQTVVDEYIKSKAA